MEKPILDCEFAEQEIPYGGIVDNPFLKEWSPRIKELEEKLTAVVDDFTNKYGVTPIIKIETSEIKTKCTSDDVLRFTDVKVNILI